MYYMLHEICCLNDSLFWFPSTKVNGVVANIYHTGTDHTIANYHIIISHASILLLGTSVYFILEFLLWEFGG